MGPSLSLDRSRRLRAALSGKVGSMLLRVRRVCNAAAGAFAVAVDPDQLMQIMSGGSRAAGLPVARADAFVTSACFASG